MATTPEPGTLGGSDGLSPNQRALIGERLLRHALPWISLPAGELPDLDLLTGLVEGRLDAAESAALIREIEGSAAARAELQTLAPEVFARHFPETLPAGVLRFPRAEAFGRVAVGVAAAAAVLAVAGTGWLLWPTAATEGAALTLSVPRLERSGGAAGPISTARAGQPVDLLVRLEPLRPLDAWRGGRAWAAVFQVGPEGERVLACTTADHTCPVPGRLHTSRWHAPMAPGRYRLVLVSGTRDPERVRTLGGAGGVEALEAAARAHDWHLSSMELEVVPW